MTVGGEITSPIRTGVAVAVGVGVRVRVGVMPVNLGVGVGARKTSRTALPLEAALPIPVSSSTAEMMAVPSPTAKTRLLKLGSFGAVATLGLLELYVHRCVTFFVLPSENVAFTE